MPMAKAVTPQFPADDLQLFREIFDTIQHLLKACAKGEATYQVDPPSVSEINRAATRLRTALLVVLPEENHG